MPLILIMIMIASPLMGVPFLIYVMYKAKRKIDVSYTIPFAILYGVLGYHLYPGDENDLTRYYSILDGMKNKSILQVIEEDLNGLYTRDILFHYVNCTGDNQLLPFLVGFFCYAIIFYIFFDTINRFKVLDKKNGKRHVLLMGMLITSIISPYSIISNVRCVFAYLVIVLAIYREWVQKKRNFLTLFFYIVPSGLHTTAIGILLLRFAVPVLKKFPKLVLSAIILLPVIIDIVYQIVMRISFANPIWNMFASAIRKVYYFFHWTEGGWADEVGSSLSNILNRWYGAVYLIIFIIIYFNLKRKHNYTNFNIEKFSDFIYMTAVLAIACLSIKTGAFWRIETIVVVFSHIMFFQLLDSNKKYINVLYVLYASGLVMFMLNAIHFWRNIQMYKFLQGYVLTSIVPFILSLLKGMIYFF